MKLLFRILCILFPVIAVGQYSTQKLHTIKSAEDVLTPQSLSKQLTAEYKTDREKVTSIFRWITENISYNVRPFYRTNRKYSNELLDEDDDTAALKPLSERVAIDVLNKRVAFCDGYARLFKTLCDYAGIKSEIITGYANSNSGRAMYKFGSNHRWNAVYLDSSWQLLDATWASGHLTLSTNDFIQSYNNRYFLTPARDFIQDHYPEDLLWTLLPEPPEKSEFRQTPFKAHAFLKNNVISYSPSTGVIEASQGDTLRFEIQTFGEKKNLLVLDTAFVDSAAIVAATADIFKNTSVVAGNKIKYSFIVSSSLDKWLTVVLNDEVVMRYKLNIRKNETAAK